MIAKTLILVVKYEILARHVLWNFINSNNLQELQLITDSYYQSQGTTEFYISDVNWQCSTDFIYIFFINKNKTVISINYTEARKFIKIIKKNIASLLTLLFKFGKIIMLDELATALYVKSKILSGLPHTKAKN